MVENTVVIPMSNFFRESDGNGENKSILIPTIGFWEEGIFKNEGEGPPHKIKLNSALSKLFMECIYVYQRIHHFL